MAYLCAPNLETITTVNFYHNTYFFVPKNMANHKSSKKRVRQTAKRRLRNRYQKKSTRTAIKRLRSLSTATDAVALYPKVASMIDKLAKKGQFHPNKAANLKSGLAKLINKLRAAQPAA